MKTSEECNLIYKRVKKIGNNSLISIIILRKNQLHFTKMQNQNLKV